jgi:cell division protein FtsB
MPLRFKHIDKIPAWMRNKYLITLLIFVLWLLVFDANNLIERWRDIRKYRTLQQDREYFSGKINEERGKLEEIRSDNESLEKFAREQYRMKKPDEDIYIIVSPEEERRIQRESTIRK